MASPAVRIGRLTVAAGRPVVIVAEAGVNHNGSIEHARRLVTEARRAGADCVKFQTFSARQVAAANAPKAAYQLLATGLAERQIEMLERLELPAAEHRELQSLAAAEGIEFLSTPYGPADADFLDELGVPAFKLASLHVVEPHLLRHVAAKGKPMLLSTGMATQDEIAVAVRTVRDAGNDDLVLLQCTTDYPSRPDDANLLAIRSMRDAFGLLVGYSDHTPTPTASIVAVGLGAVILERHFTLDRTMTGPDHSSSLDPAGFAAFVASVREAERCLGDGVKTPCAAELANARGMRRSIVAGTPMKAGTVLTYANVTLKRPADGLLGTELPRVVGRRLARDVAADQPITLDLLQ